MPANSSCEANCGLTLERISTISRKVLALYRKREPRCVYEYAGVARFRYSDLKEAARVAADAGAMQIQLRKSRFGGGAERHGRVRRPRGREEELLKAQMWCGKDDLGE